MDMQFEEQEYQGNIGDANGSSQASKVKKLVVPRSDVWKNFSRTKESRDKCICHHCHTIFSCASKSGTSNLKKHLQICKEHQSWLTSQNKNQQQLGSEGRLTGSRVSEKVFLEACNELVMLAELPLSFIESHAPLKKNFDKEHCGDVCDCEKESSIEELAYQQQTKSFPYH